MEKEITANDAFILFTISIFSMTFSSYIFLEHFEITYLCAVVFITGFVVYKETIACLTG